MEKLNCSVYEIFETIEDLLKEDAVIPLCVSGSSMNPFLISRRDVVYLRSADDGFKRGQIILFGRNDGTLVLHRIKNIFPDGRVEVNGDAQTWSEVVTNKQIIAVVCEIERKGKIRKADSLYWKTVNGIWRILTPLRSLMMRVWFRIRRI